MQRTTKINAFTLSEMVVVLIITSIVVGLAFSVLSLVQKHMFSIKNNFMYQTELNKLEQSLYIDLNRFSYAEYKDTESTIHFKNELDSCRYKFHANAIVKNRDTFNIQLKQKTFFFEGTKTQNGIIDAIKLETTDALQNQILFMFKDNDATYFMNHGI